MTPDGIVHVIDDDNAMRESLAFLLEGGGFQVRTYETAAPFLEGIGGLVGDCIVTDIRMPGMNGLDLVRYLRALGSDLPIIVITGHGDVPLAVEAMKAGVNDFLEKPFDGASLVNAVHTALNGSAAGRALQLAEPFQGLVTQLSPRETVYNHR